MAVAPAFAALVAAVFLGYATGARRGSESPQAIATYPLYAASRGDETIVAPKKNAQFYTLFMDRTWERDDASYTAVLRDDPGGAERFSVQIGAVPLGRSIQVLIPVKTLSNGRYVLAIKASDGSEVARYPFRLQFE